MATADYLCPQQGSAGKMSVINTCRGLPNPALIALIDDLYGRYGDIDEIIEDAS